MPGFFILLMEEGILPCREFPERSRTFNIDVTWPNWSGKYALQNESFKIRTEWESAV